MDHPRNYLDYTGFRLKPYFYSDPEKWRALVVNFKIENFLTRMC